MKFITSIAKKMLAIFDEKIEIRERCKGVQCVDLGESFPTSIYLQKSASIQPRTSPSKFVGELFNIIHSRPYSKCWKPGRGCPGRPRRGRAVRRRSARRRLRPCASRSRPDCKSWAALEEDRDEKAEESQNRTVFSFTEWPPRVRTASSRVEWKRLKQCTRAGELGEN